MPCHAAGEAETRQSPTAQAETVQQRSVAILQLLWALPSHLYDIERQLAALEYMWSTHGAVIRHLKGLQADGLVTSVWETPQYGCARLG